ncbi:MAG: hypothetical protein ACR2FH_02025 [Caulobacteraceae bacterium]
MSDPQPPGDPSQRDKALSRWDNEGGAEPDGPQLSAPEALGVGPGLSPSPAEWAELRTRVIALENLMIALLATASKAQRALAREMARYIAPRPGFTHHRLTVHAAHRMTDLIGRAERFDEQGVREI